MSDRNLMEPLFQTFDEMVSHIDPTPDNMEALFNTMFDALATSKKVPRAKLNRVVVEERAKWINLCRQALRTGQVGNLDMAMAGLKELGSVVWESGIPQAALTFAVTYKLIDGILSAGEEAQSEYGLPQQ